MTNLTPTEQAAYLAWYELEVAPSHYDEYLGTYIISWDDAVKAHDGSRYVSNPYILEIHGCAHNEWLSPDSYYELCQDI